MILRRCVSCGQMAFTTLLLLMCMTSIHVDSGSVQKRAADEKTGPIHILLDDIGGRQPVDLILAMDRSHSFSIETFYLREKKMVQAILKQYATLSLHYVRLAIITFAKDVTVVMDTISNPDSAPNKCMLFNGNDSKWDNDVIYTQDEANLKGTNMKGAFLEARKIFQEGKKHRANRTRILILLSDGKYNEQYDPVNEAKELKVTLGVRIYGVSIGTWHEDGNVRVVTSTINDTYLFGTEMEWTNLIGQLSTRLSYTTDTPPEWATMSSCTIDCMPNSNCYCDIDRGVEQCRCNAGYFLNETQSTCDECPLSTYKPESGNDECTPCPPGTSTTNTGSRRLTDCYCLSPPCNDPCVNMTCNDHQVCLASNDADATCVCKDGWEGINCAVNHDACSPNKCMPGSSCVDGLGPDVYSCVCTTWGYSGRFCEINQDECTSDICQNNSTCTDNINNFKCNCMAGWIGRFCQDRESDKTTTTTPITTTSQRPTAAASGEDNTLWIIIGASVGGGILVIVVIIVIACCVCHKRKEKNQEEVKKISQQFSGFWKKRTIRGSKYAKEMEEDANGGLPSAPSGHRPDLIESTSNPYTSIENLKNEEYAEIPYETVTLKTGMESWQNYLTELDVSKVVDRALIAKISAEKNAQTTSWMYDIEENARVVTLMEEVNANVPLLLQDSEYHIQENDGTMAVGKTIGSFQEPKVVAVGKTKTYIIIAIALEESDKGMARKEVQWVVDHISGEGY